MADRFELRNCGERFFFILRSGDSREVVLTGELYSTKAAALNAVEAARVNAAIDRRYQRRVSQSSGLPYFVLCSASQDVLATSKVYTSALLRNRAIAELKAHARQASLEDETHPRARRLALVSATSTANDERAA